MLNAFAARMATYSVTDEPMYATREKNRKQIQEQRAKKYTNKEDKSDTAGLVLNAQFNYCICLFLAQYIANLMIGSAQIACRGGLLLE